MTETAWEEWGPAPADLPEARLVLHQAVQLVAAVGQSLLPAAPDDSQQSLVLSADLQIWLGKLKAGLDPTGLVLLLDEKRFPLAGRSMAEGLAFLQGELGKPLTLPKHPPDFPHHPLADGARFPLDGEASRAFLTRLFANTQRVLEIPLRMWPHHFDLAGAVKSANAGFSPGDGSKGLPYWYATFSPPPKVPPVIAGKGRWRSSGWIGAELELSQIEPGAGYTQVQAFFRSAML
jgi:hypothetical protein